MNKLEEARLEINEIDKEMAKLFVRRMRASENVADFKKEHGLKVTDPIRECEVIRRNSELVTDTTLREYYVNFLRDAMAASRSYQERIMSGMKVAFSGTEGAFAHIAACKHFPTSKMVAFGNFQSAYEAVENGECDAAVLPIENSYNGEVGQVTDLMFSGSLYVNAITELAVTHDLLAIKGTDISSITEVVSHPQALAQCGDYIRRHGYTEREYVNTALAAKYVSELQSPTVAAIASEQAAELYGLTVLDKNINASNSNTTRFAVFTRAENKHPKTEMGLHTILLFTVRNEAGALAKAIDVIGKHGFNMRTLRSRPMKELLWQYYFYVEAEGNINTDEGKAMIDELSSFCDRLRAVGSYVKE